jgi:hypothetical protein
MKQANDYIIEILERVKGLETMLRDYEDLEESTEEAKALATKAREEVAAVREKIEAEEYNRHDTKKWSKRTVIASIISMLLILLGNIIFTLLKIKFKW